MQIVWGSVLNPQLNNAISAFVASRIWGDDRGFEKFTTMGVIDNGRMIAGVVYHNFDPHSGVIEISAASDHRKWLCRRVIREMYGYPFADLGCQMVLQRISANNPYLASVCQRLGFEGQTVKRLYGRNEDAILFTMTEESWKSGRFYKETKHG